MPELHQIVDQIRAIVQSNDQTRSAILDGLSSAYAQACGDVNQRLGRCHRLLQQGLRSEAIQLAESEPKLLDASATLDFPERAAWDELVAIYNLTPASKIQIDAAQFLNQAYAEQEPLADLLRNHRRLALQRASLRPRIAVLRQLAAQDSNNLIWADDLKTFEQARVREIQEDAAEAVKARDPARLARLIEELQGQTWLEPPPKSLLPKLAKADAELRGQQARTALADAETRLSEAFAARDPILGQSARQTWEKLASSISLGSEDPARKRVEPVLDWLGELDRKDRAERDYHDALADLVRLLDEKKHVPPRALDRAARAVLDHGRGLAEDLQRRYIARMQTEERARTTRFWIIGLGSAALLVIVASLSYSLVRSTVRADRAESVAAKVRKLIDPLELSETRLKEAREMLTSIEKEDPDLLSDAGLSEVRKEVHRLTDAEDARNSQFEQTLSDFKDADLTTAETPVVKKLEELAGRDGAKLERIRQIVDKRQENRVALQRRAAEKVGPLLEQAETGIDGAREILDAAALHRVADIEGCLEKARRSLREAATGLGKASDKFKTREQSLRQALEAEERDLVTLKRRRDSVQQIAETLSTAPAVGNAMMARFASHLNEYINAFPGESQTADMKRTLENDRSIWNAIDAWNALADSWRNDPGGLTANSSKRAEKCKRFLDEHPAFPDAADLDAYRRHAEAISLRESTKAGPKTTLRKLFEHPSIDQVYVLTLSETFDGKPLTKRYYGPKPGQPGDDRFEHYSSPNGGALVAKKFDRAGGETPVLAPQSKLARRVLPQLREQSKLANWEGFIIGLFDEIVLNADDIDPILQVQLLRSVLRLGTDGSEPLRQSMPIAPLQKELDEAAKRLETNWVDPENRNADQARVDARNFVHSLTLRKLEQQRDQIDEARRRIESSVRRSYHCVGWLSHTTSGWQLRKAAQTRASGELIVPAPKQSAGEWKAAGSMINGQEKLAREGDSAFAEGRPVFVRIDL
jgi:hypothetical protein